MKKYIRLFTFVLLMTTTSCSNKSIPKNNYDLETQTSYDKVWENIVQYYFATKGGENKDINKDNGYATPPDNKISLPLTTLTKKRNLLNPNAYLYMPIICKPRSKKQTSGELSGEWNIQIKKNPKGGTIVNVNIIKINNYSSLTLCRPKRQYRAQYLNKVVTTGVFEKKIFDIIK